jgi:hypothetical protein
MPKLFEQFESPLSCVFERPSKPWKSGMHKSRKADKLIKHRAERRRARKEPETMPLYRKYRGYEY